jgi:hypothetical protein
MEIEICRQVLRGEAQEGLTERPIILQGQNPERETEGKGDGSRLFLHIANFVAG